MTARWTDLVDEGMKEPMAGRAASGEARALAALGVTGVALLLAVLLAGFDGEARGAGEGSVLGPASALGPAVLGPGALGDSRLI